MSTPERSGRRGSPATKLKAALAGQAEVLEPHESEEPILAAPVRLAVFGWLAEINAANELAAAKVKPRTTALLSGPPGCGKTTLAHHVAARLGIPLVNVGAENLLASFLGEAEKNVAKLFDGLRAADERCVVFLDELDAIGSKRGEEKGGGATQARNSMLTVLLRKIESFQGLLIAATNIPDKLDPALWRRFGMQIEVALPDEDARFAILKRYGEPFDFGDEALEELVVLTEGASPALLRQLMEGVKRLLVIGERIRQPASSAAATFAAIVAQNRPHPDYTPPPLWEGQGAQALAAVTWPPVRRAA